MNVAIVKYNAGNNRSVLNALERLGVSAVVTDDISELKNADKVIFPGVGEASTAMNFLRTRGLDTAIRSMTQPVLGICLGMQLLCEFSDENDTECLGLLPYTVKHFEGGRVKVPHMGWNSVADLSSPLFDGIAEDSYFYFVHGYYVEKGEATIASTVHAVQFSAAVRHDNFYAVQFHPERSGLAGEQILRNFLQL